MEHTHTRSTSQPTYGPQLEAPCTVNAENAKMHFRIRLGRREKPKRAGAQRSCNLHVCKTTAPMLSLSHVLFLPRKCCGARAQTHLFAWSGTAWPRLQISFESASALASTCLWSVSHLCTITHPFFLPPASRATSQSLLAPPKLSRVGTNVSSDDRTIIIWTIWREVDGVYLCKHSSCTERF